MQIEVQSDAEAVTKPVAVLIAEHARMAFAASGRFILTVSGGHTSWRMLRRLGKEEVPWSGVHVRQVDGRIAAPGDLDRNLTHLQGMSLEDAPVNPVEIADAQSAATEDSKLLEKLLGSFSGHRPVAPGLGPDGHTLRSFPAIPFLQITDTDVAITGVYQGYKRMTLTYPVINRSRQILTDGEKAKALFQLENADLSAPRGRIHRSQALLLADKAAARTNVGTGVA